MNVGHSSLLARVDIPSSQLPEWTPLSWWMDTERGDDFKAYGGFEPPVERTQYVRLKQRLKGRKHRRKKILTTLDDE